MEKSKKKFGEGYSFEKIFAFFILGCFVGVVYETILAYVQARVIQPHVGLIYGPFNPVYGLGFSMFYIVLGKKSESWSIGTLYVICSFLGGLVEYVLSYLEEVLFHTQAWNYSNMPLNFHGRTAVPVMLFWGLGGIVLLKWIYPALSKVIEKIPVNFGKKMMTFLLVFIIFDSIVTFGAELRHAERRDGIPAENLYEELLDYYFPDEVLDKIFQNVKSVAK